MWTSYPQPCTVSDGHTHKQRRVQPISDEVIAMNAQQHTICPVDKRTYPQPPATELTQCARRCRVRHNNSKTGQQTRFPVDKQREVDTMENEAELAFHDAHDSHYNIAPSTRQALGTDRLLVHAIALQQPYTPPARVKITPPVEAFTFPTFVRVSGQHELMI